MEPAIKRKDLPWMDARQIAAEAATWKGTPYREVGANSEKSVKGDCSGTTYKIYMAAKFPYAYQRAKDFPAYALRSGLFRQLEPGEDKQDGDILSWPNHMAIYASFAADSPDAVTDRTNAKGQKWKQKNNMWTASHLGGNPYAPAELRFWRSDPPSVFRYQK